MGIRPYITQLRLFRGTALLRLDGAAVPPVMPRSKMYANRRRRGDPHSWPGYVRRAAS